MGKNYNVPDSYMLGEYGGANYRPPEKFTTQPKVIPM
jgi:hypothetical protein